MEKIITSLKCGKIQNIAILTGAGVSCASGIPDFRSPGGLYETLRPDLLTATDAQKQLLTYNPTAVVNISLFSVNQFPYLEVRRPFILGTAEQRWKPTISHFFAEVLHKKGLLRRLYTQNIDGLDSNLEIEVEKIIHVHGTLSKIECEFCKVTYPVELFREEVRTKIRNIYDPFDASAPESSSNIYCRSCSKAGVKPATVMYGSALPKAVFRNIAADFPANVDLLIIAGTSLTVAPACNLVTMVKEGTPRLLVNNEMVGLELGLDFSGRKERTVDAFLQGECDQGFLFLCRELGWLEDLFTCMDRMCPASVAALRQALETN